MPWFKAQASGDRTAKVVIDRAIGSDWAPDWVADLFGDKAAREFIDAIEAFGELDQIDLELNSPGGDVYSGIRIMNYLRNHKATVNVRVTGMAASIATVVMLGGDSRTMAIGSQLMTHRAAAGMCGFFTKADLDKYGEQISKVDQAVVEAITSVTGKSAEEVGALLDQGDTYLSADEAIEWGFATAKDEGIRAVASADFGHYRMQLEMQGKVNALKAQVTDEQAKAKSLKAQIDSQASNIENLMLELESFRNPKAATADEVISMCAEAGLESMAVAMAKEKLPLATVEARLKLAAEVKDIAAAGGLDADVLMQHISNPTQMLRTAITEAKALTDQDLDHHHTPGTGTTAKQPDHKRAYAQLNNLGG